MAAQAPDAEKLSVSTATFSGTVTPEGLPTIEQRTVHDETERSRAVAEGWVFHQSIAGEQAQQEKLEYLIQQRQEREAAILRVLTKLDDRLQETPQSVRSGQPGGHSDTTRGTQKTLTGTTSADHGHVDQRIVTSEAEKLHWEDVEIRFLSKQRIQTVVKENLQEPADYIKMGFMDKRSQKPRAAWETLCQLAECEGVIKATKNVRERPKLEKRMQEIRRFLKTRFSILDDPVPYEDGAYRARVRLKLTRSYHEK